MNNNDINKIIENIKNKIEECITYLKQEKYIETVKKLKEINGIYAKNLNTIRPRDITNELQEKYRKEMKEFDQVFETSISKINIEYLCQIIVYLYCVNKDNLVRKVINYFKKILQREKSDISILFKIGQRLFEIKKYYYANKFFKKILDLGTDDLEVLFNTGIYLYKLGQPEKGFECFEKVLNNTNDISKLYSRATEIRYLKENNVIISNTRDEYFYKILDIPENNVEEIFYKGMSAYWLLIDDKAKDYFEKVAEFEKNNTNNMYISAEHLYLLKQYTSAKKCYEKIFLMDISDISDINILGNVGEKLYELGESKKVIERFNEILNNLNNIKSIYYLANILQRLGEFKEVEKYYREIWRIGLSNKNDIQELNIMAMTAKILDKRAKAKEYFENILNMGIQDIFLLYDIGINLKGLEEENSANECFEKILESNVISLGILFRKGMAAKLLNKKKEAKGYFKDLLKCNVQDIVMLYDTGIQLNQLNESKSAQQCFKKISNNNNYDENNIYLLYKKGMAEYLLPNKDNAMKYFEKILNKIKEIKDTQFLISMGNTMLKLGNKEKAKECFETILAVDFDMEFDYVNKGIAYLVLQKLEGKDDLKLDFEKNYWSAIEKYREELKKDNGEIDYEKLQKRIFTYNVFSPFVSDFLDEKDNSNNKHLYHYTSIKGLKGILENKELWVTKSEFLNDPTEISYIKDVVDNIKKYTKTNIKTNIKMERISKKINEFYDKKYKENDNKEDNNKKDVYVLSMSTEQDSLPMWSNYSKDDGYNIQFNKQSLKNKFMEPQSYRPHTYGRVRYIDKKDKDGLIYRLIKSIYESAEKCKVEKDENIVIETILANIRMIALFVKHIGFKYENEYRFVFIPDFWKLKNISSYSIQQGTELNRDGNADKNQNKNRSYANENIEYGFKPSKGILIPFIKIPIDINKSLIEKIFTSPTSDETLTKQGIEDFYKLKCGDVKIEVEKSDIPLRDI